MIQKHNKNNKAKKTNKHKSSKKNYKSKKNLVGGAGAESLRISRKNTCIDTLINNAARVFVNKIYISTGTTNNKIDNNISKVYQNIASEIKHNKIPADPRLLDAIINIIVTEIKPKYKELQFHKNTIKQQQIQEKEADIEALTQYRDKINTKDATHFKNMSTVEYYDSLVEKGFEPESLSLSLSPSCTIL